MDEDEKIRLTRLESRVDALEAERPGRKTKPILVSEDGVCGIDPDRDSASCPDASVYRRQKGCKGTRCKQITDAYYESYRQSKKTG